MQQTGKNKLLAFYGDDFTGATDALECICKAGAKALLFMELPQQLDAERLKDLDVIGIAGKTRSLPVAGMKAILSEAFEKIKAAGVRQVHYKVCSTFDSSPAIGSIGCAMEVGQAVFNTNTIPVLGGAPSLGRYCVFGNLFAGMGTGGNREMYRLDRHPSMSKHPVTPADESDLRLHLSRQLSRTFGLIDILQQDKPVQEWSATPDGDAEVILIDALYGRQLPKIGEWLDTGVPGAIVFSVGGSGVETALGAYWNRTGILQRKEQWPAVAVADPLLVVSGSCSPVTAKQIAYARSCGFNEVIIDAISVCNNGVPSNVFEVINKALASGSSVIVHTGSKAEENVPSEKLGTALGTIVKQVLYHNKLKRVVIAGGDTSSYTARAMEIAAVEMIAPIVTGAPLCRAISSNKYIDGLELNFKGGQVGDEDYFEVLRAGRE
ncbi:four-carbon acid sugar kinase family protein [Niabella soli]|uniref:HPr kinase n=1 Tax=Niabella soli DSM 19437 TaxID=929713 RepID=W0F5Y7_9BACT|nr:four-carbon acid sugar kinase family protein [Niabella soli]AHF16884.1 HPr kinase [Niabella soli DSM 19437]